MAKFSIVCGENVTLSESCTKVEWNVPKVACGWVCSKEPMVVGGVVTVTGRGSGQYQVGFITEDPASLTDTINLPITFKPTNDVSLHKKDCFIEVTRSSSGREVTAVFNTKPYKRTAGNSQKIWLTLNVIFGAVELSMKCKDASVEFSPIHGRNTTLNSQQTIATQLMNSPASICAIGEPFESGDRVILNSFPIENPAHRGIRACHLGLLFHTESPERLQQTFPQGFRATDTQEPTRKPTLINCLTKADVTGMIIVTRQNQRISYTSGSGKAGHFDIGAIDQDKVWIILDLYRVQVEIVKRCKVNEGESDTLDTTKEAQGTVKLELERKLDIPGDKVNKGGFDVYDGPSGTKSRDQQERKIDVQRYFTYLRDHLLPIPLTDHLYQESIIGDGELNQILNTARHKSDQDATRDLLLLLKRKKITYEKLEHLLKEIKQEYLLPYFYP